MSLYKGNNLISGHNILYSTTGQNTDGAMTQKATSDLTKLMNVLLVGNVTVSDYVLSGLSQSNYAKFPSNFQPSLNTWEMVFKVTTGNDVSGEQYIVSMAKGTVNADRFALRVFIVNGKFALSSTYSGTTWDINATGTYSILANTEYYVKAEYTGSAYILSYSLDGETYTEDINIADATPTYNNFGECLIGSWSVANGTNTFNGSIDLKESYIKIGNNIWWSGVDYIKNINDFKNGNIFNKSIDGQWVGSVLTMVNGSAKLGNYSFDLSDYLPNDGYNYEVIVTCDGSTLATSGAQADVRVTSSIISSNIFLAKTMTRTTQSVAFGGNCILPIGTDRILSYNIINSSLSNLRLFVVGYRRVGTNA